MEITFNIPKPPHKPLRHLDFGTLFVLHLDNPKTIWQKVKMDESNIPTIGDCTDINWHYTPILDLSTGEITWIDDSLVFPVDGHLNAVLRD